MYENYTAGASVHPAETVRPVPVVSVGEWFLTLFLMAIPLVNLIILLAWAFGDGTNPNKANWAKAALAWMILTILLSLCFFSTLMSVLKALL